MVSITSCQDWDITTVEKVGNKLTGYSIIQTTLAEHNGTQCGYCTPGWIMAMYSLLHTNVHLTKLEIEKSFGSNVCRCTGYRPILDAFKKFAIDTPNPTKLPDIEDLHIHQKCAKNCGKKCSKEKCTEDDWCFEAKVTEIDLKDGKKWFRVYDVDDIFKVLQREGDDSYMLVAGNTAKGAYPIEEYPRILIDISKVSSIKGFIVDQNLVIGAGTTLTDTMEIFQHVSSQEYFRYLQKFHDHLNLVAHIPVRNIMPRAQNAHAIVNAGFLYKLDSNGRVLESRIAYGGLSPVVVRAAATETYLIGRDLFTNETLQLAIGILESELHVLENPPEPSALYRRRIAVNLFYKGLLYLYPEYKLPLCFRSGAIKIRETRPVSEARQIFDTNPSLWPLNQPIPKVEALIQCSGEAPYTEDLPSIPREVFAAFVLSTIPKGHIVAIDPRPALLEHGVIAFYSAADIPGLNSFTPPEDPQYSTNEEVLCSGEVKYYNQPLGIIVATTRSIADRAAKMVNVKYSNVKPPVIAIKKAKKDPKRNTLYFAANAKNRGNDIIKVIKGQTTVYGQYHFSMETLVCVTKPMEQGIEIHPASQWMDGVHLMVSRALKMDQNRIDIKIRRLGGAYGIKVSRSTQVAVACSLVTQKLNLPCRFIQSLTTNMRAVGKRFPCSTDYEVGVNIAGAVQYLNMNLYEDNGFDIDELLSMLGIDAYYNCYDNSRWNYKCFNSTTDTAKNTWCRSPATLENIAAAETMMERISYELSLDPIEVRLANVDDTRYIDIREIVANLKVKADYNNRRSYVEKFNSENKWKKRGLRTAFLRWTPLGTTHYDVTLSVYHGDGTVAITHGGVEMGQGVNTKAVQIAAYFLKIPIDKIQIKANDTMVTPNSHISAGSFTSQYVGIGVQRACEQMNKKLAPIRAQMKNPTWEELVERAYRLGVDLQSHGFVGANDFQNYNIYGVTFAEVEVDVLTGEYEILRVDLLEDVGLSVSPEIDIGQVEGAFIMGVGYWTSEELVYNERTGEILTDRTWNYYIPQARDIPQDFRVYFRRKSYSTPAALGSKMTGEPPLCMAVAIPFAIREAIAAARKDSGIPTTLWFDIDGPYTVESVCLAADTKTIDYRFY
ncbi:xanthine dehydrogenase-like [Pectinophora gossypiella]|uniref:xanthine dehydrogenase-like n=1 Tax=Pectinophora gossypiella TaxID=13191 RepID=UPI00214E9388|nr:xanthine dehydrogenase-like [Pectinophora gossypiella]